MVDFTKHLKQPHPPHDGGIIRGTFSARIEPASGSEPHDRECEWEIGPYNAIQGEWTTFKITKGGVTGYESFILKDDEGLYRYSLNRIFIRDPDGHWCANAGGGGWDAMYISNAALREAIQQWIYQENINYPGKE